MSFILFLNELSFGTAADRWAANVAMAEFDSLLRTFSEWNKETSLIDHVGLSSGFELAPGYKIAQWISAERPNRDRWREILLRKGKAPFKDPAIPGDVEYKYSDWSVRGLGYADHYDSLCVSLLVDDVWDSAEIVVDRMVLDHDAAEAAGIRTAPRRVQHSATCENAASHRSRWQERRPLLPILREGRRFYHDRFGKIIECLETKYFYSVDHAGHGSSAVKRFIERADALYWDADLDKEGSVIQNKHKSDVGMCIPKTELHAV